MSGILRHVTEVESHIKETIRIRMMLNGNPLNTTRALRIKDLPGGGLINIDVHQLKQCLRHMPQLQFHVLVNGKLKLILPPIYLLICVRITFDYSYNGEDVSLIATGLKEQQVDMWWRIRWLEDKRHKEFTKREKIPQLVWVNIGRPVIEGTETRQRSEINAFGTVSAQGNGRLEEIDVAKTTIELNDDDSGPNVGNLLSPSSLSSLSDLSYDPLEQNDDGERLRGQQTDRTSSDLMYPEASMEEGLSEEQVAEVSINDRDAKLEKKFGNTLIGYSSDEGSFESNLIEEREEFRQCETIILKDGFYVFKFPGLEAKMNVLEHGQLFINDIPLILKRWSPNLVFERSRFLSSVPIWVRIFNINWGSWTIEYLSKVCEDIGVFLYMDKCTATVEHLEYARVCVEIDPDKELPETINVLEHEDGDKTIPILVSYEWKPQICKHCTSLCHHSSSCRLVGEEISLHREDSYVSIEELKSSDIASHEDGGGGDDTANSGFGENGLKGTTLYVPEFWGKDGELVPESVTNEANWLRRILMYFSQPRRSFTNSRPIERSISL